MGFISTTIRSLRLFDLVILTFCFLTSQIGFTQARNSSNRNSPPTRVLSVQETHFDASRLGESLRSFSVHTENYEIVWRGMSSSFGTSMRASYTTERVADLENYAVVQFIRGCYFHSRWDGQVIHKDVSLHRDLFGQSVPFRHPEWVIDSIGVDPMYWGTSEHPSRHHYYSSARNAGVYESRHSDFWGIRRPTVPELYVTDYPSSGYAISRFEANNVSLEFRTCIYHTADIPRVTTPSNINFATPLHCVEWRSSHIYDFQNHQFTESTQIDPFCLELTHQ